MAGQKVVEVSNSGHNFKMNIVVSRFQKHYNRSPRFGSLNHYDRILSKKREAVSMYV